MNQDEMIQSLRDEITKLQRVLDLLLEGAGEVNEPRRPGRPKSSSNQFTSFNPEEFAPKKRTMSAEGKARIAEAQKKRWAAQKGAAQKTKTASAKRPAKASAPAVPTRVSGLATKKVGQGKGRSAPKTTGAKSTKAAGKKSAAKSRSVRPATKAASKLATSTSETQTAA